MNTEKLAKKAYKAFIKGRDANWRHNHPKWKNLNLYARQTWLDAAEVFKELLDGR